MALAVIVLQLSRNNLNYQQELPLNSEDDFWRVFTASRPNEALLEGSVDLLISFSPSVGSRPYRPRRIPVLTRSTAYNYDLKSLLKIGKACLRELCEYLAKSMVLKKTRLLFNFSSYDPKDAAEVLDCLDPLVGVTSASFIVLRSPLLDLFVQSTNEEADDMMIQSLIRHKARSLTKRDGEIAPVFDFNGLPLELQRMILEYVVTEDEAIIIGDEDVYMPSLGTGCCGFCSCHTIRRRWRRRRCGYHECYCNGPFSFSSDCRCVRINEGVFLVSKALRAEALKLYWSNNIFAVDERKFYHLGFRPEYNSEGPRHRFNVPPPYIPNEGIAMIRDLIIVSGVKFRCDLMGQLTEFPRTRLYFILQWLEEIGSPLLYVQIYAGKNKKWEGDAWRKLYRVDEKPDWEEWTQEYEDLFREWVSEELSTFVTIFCDNIPGKQELWVDNTGWH